MEMTWNHIKKWAVFPLLITVVGCSEAKKTTPIELMTSGIITCVNQGGGTTCFAGRYPAFWDGKSMPDAPIVFHRPDARARVVGPWVICLEDGVCFGDPWIGTLEAAEIILQPPEFGSNLSTSLNLMCWLDAAGKPECWGHRWGLTSGLSSEELRRFSGRYSDMSVSNHSLCGSTSTGVSCEPLSIYANDHDGLFLEFEGFEAPCQDELYVCARKVGSPSDVTCWFALPPEEAMRLNDAYGVYPQVVKKGVLEYSCGGKACLNFGDRVECYSHENMDGERYDVKVRELSAGHFHFCGVTEGNEVLCRDWGDMPANFYEKHRSIELLSLESWRELMESSKTPKDGKK